MTIRHRILSILASFLISGFLVASGTYAQPAQLPEFDNICSLMLFEEVDQAEGLKSFLTEEWGGSDWSASGRAIYTRSNGDVTEILFQERSSGTWADVGRALPGYDTGGRLEVCTLQSWEGGAWQDAFRFTRTFYGDGNVETTTTELWDEGSWVKTARSNFTYDENDNLEVEREEYCADNCSSEAPMWDNYYRTTNEYDGSNRLVKTTEEYWDSSTMPAEWREDWLTTYSYASKATTVTAVVQQWNVIANNWVNWERITTHLNDDELPTEAITDTWQGGWVRETREETTYAPVDGTQKVALFLEQTCASGCPEAQTPTWENANRTLFSYDQVLPVELTSFVVTEGDNAALLAWATASETNNAGFEVQRRIGTVGAFEAIGFVDGAGTTSVSQSYRFTDATLPYQAEQVTYRLKQVDLDGTAAYSPEVEFSRAMPERFVLHGSYPNPFRDRTMLRYELSQPGFVRIDVFNALGQRVARVVEQRQPAGRNEVTFEANGLPSGTYFVRLEVDGRSLLRQMTVVR